MREMKYSFWNATRDRHLIAMQKAGQSCSKIAEHLGTTRNAVIARSNRIRRVKFPSDVKRAKRRLELARRELAKKRARDKVALDLMEVVLQASSDRRAAIGAARRAGASLRTIARVLEISPQRVHAISNTVLRC